MACWTILKCKQKFKRYGILNKLNKFRGNNHFFYLLYTVLVVERRLRAILSENMDFDSLIKTFLRIPTSV